jgi:DNA processing protein
MPNPVKTFNSEHVFANAFYCIPQVGPVKLNKINSFFGSLKQAWEAGTAQLSKSGLDEKSVRIILEKRQTIDPYKKFEELNQSGLSVLLLTDPNYPPQLKEIVPPPPLIYVRGNAQALSQNLLAIVGTRKPTQYGKQAVAYIIEGLAGTNIGIVSGLALGTDSEALSQGLNSGLSSVAVLAGPLDNQGISPRENFRLAQSIINSGGCLVSEYPIGTTVQKQNFPIRNRIISGLSMGVLVTEAQEQSGALITANFALEQNRAVFAVPGSIFSDSSRGTNELIKRGARMVRSAQDIMEELNLDLHPLPITVNVEALEGLERDIIDALTNESLPADELVRILKSPTKDIVTALSMLEIKGRIKNLGRSIYAKVR